MAERDRYHATHVKSDWLRIAFHLRTHGMLAHANHVARAVSGMPERAVEIVLDGPMIGRIVREFCAGATPPIVVATRTHLWGNVASSANPVSTPANLTDGQMVAEAADAWLREYQRNRPQ